MTDIAIADTVFPGTTWQVKTPEDVGMDAAKLDEFRNKLGLASYGVVIKDGYLVYQWGTQTQHGEWASATKPLFGNLIGFAIQEGRITSPDVLIQDFGWPLIPKDQSVTFRHLANMVSGYTLPEAPGECWAYNDYGVQLYSRTLYEKMYGISAGSVSQVTSHVTHPSRLGPLQFEDGLLFVSKKGGTRINMTPRDFARLGWFWLNKGNWNGAQLLSQSYFQDTMRPQVTADLPITAGGITDDYLVIGTWGGENNQPTDNRGHYGFGWTFNLGLDGITKRWPDAPGDTFHARGHAGNHTMVMVPSLNILAAWNGGDALSSFEQNDVYATLAASVFSSTPTASFSYTPANPAAESPVHFIDESVSSNGITAWSWDFGDSTTSTEQHPSHTYAFAGTYTASLLVSEADGDTSATSQDVVVAPPNESPVANAGPDQAVGEGTGLNFNGSDSTDPDGAIVSYSWTFGDGGTGSGAAIIHTYADNGVYTATLTVTDNNGATGTDTVAITVNNVAPTAVSGGPYSGVLNQTVTFTGSVIDPGTLDTHTYSWDFGDGTPPVDGQAVSHTYTTLGTFPVTLTVTDDDGDVGTATTTAQILSTYTIVSIQGEQFYINGRPTYEGRIWNGNMIEGLLFNARLVQGIFDDLNPETRGLWKYPDTGEWDPDRNTDEFVSAMPEWRRYGMLAFTLNIQGGSPVGYGAGDWLNPGYFPDGSLRTEYMARLEKILKKADELGMVVVLGLFYFGQDQHLADEAAVRNAVTNVIQWLLDRGYRNVLIEVNNECNDGSYDHAVLTTDRVHELIELASSIEENGFRFLVGTSFSGSVIPTDNVVRVSDFILIHGNGAEDPAQITEMVQLTRNLADYHPMPILFNEDDHYNFDDPMNNLVAAVQSYSSWGFFDYRRSGEAFQHGFQSVPVDWSIDSDRKIDFFEKLSELTGTDTTAPIRSGGTPAGTLPVDTVSTTLSLATDEAANCRYAATGGTAYGEMINQFTTTGGTTHATIASGLQNGQTYNYYVRCQDPAGNANPDDYLIAFQIAPANQLPVANAGPDQAVGEGTGLNFNGSDSTDPDGAIVSYSWTFGDGGTGSGAAIIHTYADNGVYTATLTVTDNNGATGTDTVAITVNNVAPTAVSGGPYSGVLNQTVTFTGSVIDPGTLDTHTYSWDFGDGTPPADGQTVTHTYAAVGLFRVTLTVTDDDGAVVSTTTTATIAGQIEVFYDSFETAPGDNWNGLWTEDRQNDWYISSQRAVSGVLSAEVKGIANNAALASRSIDLQGRTAATITFSWLIGSSLDRGEYLSFEVSSNGGSLWTELSRLRGNVEQENVWHAMTIELTGINDLRLRFRGKMSNSGEFANVDEVRVTAH